MRGGTEVVAAVGAGAGGESAASFVNSPEPCRQGDGQGKGEGVEWDVEVRAERAWPLDVVEVEQAAAIGDEARKI